MSLLNNFLLTYEVKGSKVAVEENKKVEKSADNVDKKEKELSKTNKTLSDAFKEASDKGIDAFIKKCISATAPIAIFSLAIKKGFEFIKQGEQLEFLATKSNMATDKLQALATATKNYGGSTEATASSIENLNSMIQSLRKGEGGGGLEEAAYKYGIQISGENGLKNAEQLLDEIARRMEGLDNQSKLDLAQTVGLDEGTTRLLMQGLGKYREEVKKASKYNAFDKSTIESARKFMNNLRGIGNGIMNITGTIARLFIPVLNIFGDTIKSIIDFVIENKGLVIGFLSVVGAILLPAIITGMWGLVTATWAWLAPLLIPIAIITAIALAIQELYVWITGGESIFSLMFGDFEGVKQKFLEGIEWLKNKWESVKGYFKKLNPFSKDENDNEEIAKQDEKVQDNIEKTVNYDVNGNLSKAKATIKVADTHPLANMSNTSISNAYSSSNSRMNEIKIDNINIDARGGDAKSISENIGEQLPQSLMGMQGGLI